jgi:hypothetical protein
VKRKRPPQYTRIGLADDAHFAGRNGQAHLLRSRPLSQVKVSLEGGLRCLGRRFGRGRYGQHGLSALVADRHKAPAVFLAATTYVEHEGLFGVLPSAFDSWLSACTFERGANGEGAEHCQRHGQKPAQQSAFRLEPHSCCLQSRQTIGVPRVAGPLSQFLSACQRC